MRKWIRCEGLQWRGKGRCPPSVSSPSRPVLHPHARFTGGSSPKVAPPILEEQKGSNEKFFFCILYRWPVLVLFPVLQLVSFSVTQAPCMVTSPAALQTASASRYNSYQDGFPNISHQLFRSYPPCGIGASVRWRVFI